VLAIENCLYQVLSCDYCFVSYTDQLLLLDFSCCPKQLFTAFLLTLTPCGTWYQFFIPFFCILLSVVCCFISDHAVQIFWNSLFDREWINYYMTVVDSLWITAALLTAYIDLLWHRIFVCQFRFIWFLWKICQSCCRELILHIN